MVCYEGVHEVMTGMEPASRASNLHTILFLDALDYSIIKLGSVCRKILDVRVLEDLFLRDCMATTAFTVEHDNQLLLQGEGGMDILHFVLVRLVFQ
jgi:hypothetical protein